MPHMVEENWRVVREPGYETAYWVSDLGRVRNAKTGRVLKPGVHSKGYRSLVFSLNGKRRTVLLHRLVLDAFVGPCPEGMETRHDNGDRADNRLKNLLWGTPVENAHDRRRHGTHNAGERNGRAKVTDAQAEEISLRCRAGEAQWTVGLDYGLSQAQVSRIVTGKRRSPHSEE